MSELLGQLQVTSSIVFIVFVVGAPINKAKLAMYRRKTFQVQETTMSTTVSNTKPNSYIYHLSFIIHFHLILLLCVYNFRTTKNLSHTRNHRLFDLCFFFIYKIGIKTLLFDAKLSRYFSLFLIFIHCTVFFPNLFDSSFSLAHVSPSFNKYYIFEFHVLFRSLKSFAIG